MAACNNKRPSQDATVSATKMPVEEESLPPFWLKMGACRDLCAKSPNYTTVFMHSLQSTFPYV